MPQGYISSHQTTQGQSLASAVTSKDTIAVDNKDETDFEILDSSDIQLSTLKFTESMSTKVETHAPVDLEQHEHPCIKILFQYLQSVGVYIH